MNSIGIEMPLEFWLAMGASIIFTIIISCLWCAYSSEVADREFREFRRSCYEEIKLK